MINVSVIDVSVIRSYLHFVSHHAGYFTFENIFQALLRLRCLTGGGRGSALTSPGSKPGPGGGSCLRKERAESKAQPGSACSDGPAFPSGFPPHSVPPRQRATGRLFVKKCRFKHCQCAVFTLGSVSGPLPESGLAPPGADAAHAERQAQQAAQRRGHAQDLPALWGERRRQRCGSRTRTRTRRPRAGRGERSPAEPSAARRGCSPPP